LSTAALWATRRIHAENGHELEKDLLRYVFCFVRITEQVAHVREDIGCIARVELGKCITVTRFSAGNDLVDTVAFARAVTSRDSSPKIAMQQLTRRRCVPSCKHRKTPC
jgi:hypothetical protein